MELQNLLWAAIDRVGEGEKEKKNSNKIPKSVKFLLFDFFSNNFIW